MADIRINSLPTTASASSSDDFLALDGATNGTRKLNAYSPTFGGNLTVSGGTARFQDPTNSYGVTITTAAAKTLVETLFGGSSLGMRVGGSGSDSLTIASTGATIRDNLTVSGTGTSSFAGPLKLTYGTNLTGTDIGLFATSGGGLFINAPTTKNIRFGFNLGDRLTLDENTATFATNLTVSGGTITGGASGLSLASGGTNQNITLTPSGTGATVISKAETNTNAITTALNYIKIQNTSSGGTYIGALEFYTWDNRRAAGIFANRNNVDGTSGVLSFAYSTSGNSFAEGFRLNSTGNLLIGTTTDGGQKLQVAGTAYVGSATTTTNPLTVQGNGPNTTHQAGTATSALWNRWLNSAGTRRGYYGYASSGDSTFTIMNEENGSFVLGTNNATALTLDSSQNATFAGNYVYIGGGTSFYLRATGSGNGLWYGNNVSFDGNSFSFRNQAGTVTNQSFDSSKVFIANTQAVPATPTGGGHLYVEGGALKYKGSSGTVTTIANA